MNQTNQKPCCLVCCMLSCQFADIPVSHPALMNPSAHWHWNAQRTLAHVPPFWHGLLLLLVHSTMSEKKTQAWTFFAWFVTFCIFKKLIVSFYIFKRTILPRYPKQVSLLTNGLTENMASVKFWISNWFAESHSRRIAWRLLNFPELLSTENTALSWEQSKMLNETTHTTIVPVT